MGPRSAYTVFSHNMLLFISGFERNKLTRHGTVKIPLHEFANIREISDFVQSGVKLVSCDWPNEHPESDQESERLERVDCSMNRLMFYSAESIVELV